MSPLEDLNRQLRTPIPTERDRTRRRFDSIHWYRRAVIELSIITASAISIGLYLIGAIALARWLL